MNNHERRQPLKFDWKTKNEALSRATVCEICGKPETQEDRFECNHRVAIWFALENPCLAMEVITSLANLQIVHHSCHLKYHQQESRTFYAELAPQVLRAYLDQVVNPHLDDWRDDLRLAYAKQS